MKDQIEMGKQSKWAILKALKDAGMSVEVREDGRAFMVFKWNDRTIELSHSDDAAIDLALAILDGQLNEMPSEVDLKWALRALRGQAVLESGRLPADEKLHTNATVNAILEFMDGKPLWEGTWPELIELIFPNRVGVHVQVPTAHSLSILIRSQCDAFRRFGLSVRRFRRNHSRRVKMWWLDQSDASDEGDAGDAGDAPKYSEEQRKALDKIQESGIVEATLEGMQ